MNRTEIEDAVKNLLGRPGDTTITSLVQLWFDLAHRDVQRPYTFIAAEEQSLQNVVAGDVSLPVPANFRDPIVAYLWDPSNAKVVRFYNKTNIQTVLERRLKTAATDPNVAIDTFETYIYAIYQNVIEFWPAIGDVQASYQFGLDYYKWMDPPSGGNDDWFTINAPDVLMYHMLADAVLPLGQPETRLNQYKSLTESAFQRVMAADVSTKFSGPLRMRV